MNFCKSFEEINSGDSFYLMSLPLFACVIPLVRTNSPFNCQTSSKGRGDRSINAVDSGGALEKKREN